MIKHTYLGTLVLASATIFALSGCSGDPDPTPSPAGGATNTAGAPSGVGGASAGTTGTPVAGSNPGTGGTGTAGSGTGTAGSGVAGSSSAGDPVQGAASYASQQCSVCHGSKGEGDLGPNITGSMTAGIGSWGEAAFTRSVRESVDKNGQKLCVLMTAYPATVLPDAELKNIYAFLMSVPNDTPKRGTGCP